MSNKNYIKSLVFFHLFLSVSGFLKDNETGELIPDTQTNSNNTSEKPSISLVVISAHITSFRTISSMEKKLIRMVVDNSANKTPDLIFFTLTDTTPLISQLKQLPKILKIEEKHYHLLNQFIGHSYGSYIYAQKKHIVILDVIPYSNESAATKKGKPKGGCVSTKIQVNKHLIINFISTNFPSSLNFNEANDLASKCFEKLVWNARSSHYIFLSGSLNYNFSLATPLLAPLNKLQIKDYFYSKLRNRITYPQHQQLPPSTASISDSEYSFYLSELDLLQLAISKDLAFGIFTELPPNLSFSRKRASSLKIPFYANRVLVNSTTLSPTEDNAEDKRLIVQKYNFFGRGGGKRKVINKEVSAFLFANFIFPKKFDIGIAQRFIGGMGILINTSRNWLLEESLKKQLFDEEIEICLELLDYEKDENDRMRKCGPFSSRKSSSQIMIIFDVEFENARLDLGELLKFGIFLEKIGGVGRDEEEEPVAKFVVELKWREIVGDEPMGVGITGMFKKDGSRAGSALFDLKRRRRR